MVHHGHRLALGFEAGHEFLGVHAALEHLHGHRLLELAVGPLGQVDRTHAAFTDHTLDVEVLHHIALVGFFTGAGGRTGGYKTVVLCF